jgi:hypothetical protein
MSLGGAVADSLLWWWWSSWGSAASAGTLEMSAVAEVSAGADASVGAGMRPPVGRDTFLRRPRQLKTSISLAVSTPCRMQGEQHQWQRL